jgi:hypothetical protein
LLYEEARKNGVINPSEIRYFLGHSLGEYNGKTKTSLPDSKLALCAVGVFDPIETVKLLRLRGELVLKATQGKKSILL